MSTQRTDDAIETFSSLGVAVPEILIPSAGVNLRKFAVIACDQFTSEPEYWDEVASLVGDAPSTLHCILPEIYLDESDVAERINSVQSTALNYVSDGVLQNLGHCFILTERMLPDTSLRHGLVVALDLEAYDFSPDSTSLVRATEKTILERLPPRVRIREGAAIELPHIMVMIDDAENVVFEYLNRIKKELPQVYDTDLMLGGGRISGYMLSNDTHFSEVARRLATLVEPERIRARYGTDTPLLFPVGDGNHSLASARTYWQTLKEHGAPPDHPARYALVEVVNLHGSGMSFHPIHRLIRSVKPHTLVHHLTLRGFRVAEPGASLHNDVCLHSAQETTLLHPPAHAHLTVAAVDAVLSELADEHQNLSIDYVHDLDSLPRWMAESAVLLEMPSIDPHDIVPTVVSDGALPRKAFSIGAARDKRYYLEARRIRLQDD